MSDSLNPLDKGVIITDSNGIIRGYNHHAQVILNSSAIIGNSIKNFNSLIHQLNGKVDNLNDNYIYLFGNEQFDSPYEALVSSMSVACFTASVNGEVLFRNSAFLELFPTANDNLFDFFHSSNLKVSSFGVIVKAKKEIYYDTVLNDNRTFTLHLIPVFNELKEVDKVCGYLIEKNDIELIKKKLAQYEKMIAQRKFPHDHSAVDDLEKPYLQLKSKYMDTLYSIVSNISNKDITVLLLGKSGTGKSSIAKRIHDDSLRSSKPFVTVNCASLPENLIDSELFGYEKGAFTGASSSGKKGLVEVADGGTLFIDEIGEMPLYLQGKLLELLQEKTYRPVGGTIPKTADVRIIVATNKELLGLVSKKEFREDLYYRIAVAVINIPPLNERPEDIQTLLDAYAIYFNKKHEMSKKLTPEAKKALTHYDWPGNIRELEHTLEFLFIRSSKSVIDTSDLPNDIIDQSVHNAAEIFLASDKASTNIGNHNTSPTMIHPIEYTADHNFSFDEYMDKFESSLVNYFFSECPSSYKLASRLGISQTKASRLIRKHCK